MPTVEETKRQISLWRSEFERQTIEEQRKAIWREVAVLACERREDLLKAHEQLSGYDHHRTQELAADLLDEYRVTDAEYRYAMAEFQIGGGSGDPYEILDYQLEAAREERDRVFHAIVKLEDAAEESAKLADDKGWTVAHQLAWQAAIDRLQQYLFYLDRLVEVGEARQEAAQLQEDDE